MNRVLIAGTGSGCGKTTVVCALLQALKNRGEDVASFKCGPDYIDPMFHSEIIGAPGGNLDPYFLDEDGLRGWFARGAADLNVVEGAMGYYDGLSMDSDRASAFSVAKALSAPAVLVVNAKGMALSAAAAVRGYQTFRPDSRIAGVILNRVSPMTYPGLKKTVEAECGVPVYGSLPPMPECALESRHLGLVTAGEIADLKEKMQALARQAEKSLDLDGLIALMCAQPPVLTPPPAFERLGSVRVAIARDRAFCFYYRENLEILRDLGAELIPFSPLADEPLPECDGLILGGGYPELYAEALSRNRASLDSIRGAVLGGLPTVAECGGFMALCRSIAGFPMAGVIDAACENRGKLTRFGYAEFTASSDNLLLPAGGSIRGHEFHYWDADAPGGAWTAVKPSGRTWRCAYATDTLYAGYPHLSFAQNPDAARRFVQKCLEYRKNR